MKKKLLVLLSATMASCLAFSIEPITTKYLRIVNIQITSVNSVKVVKLTDNQEGKLLSLALELSIEGNDPCFNDTKNSLVTTEFNLIPELKMKNMSVKCIYGYDPLESDYAIAASSLGYDLRAEVTIRESKGNSFEPFTIVTSYGRDIATVHCKLNPKPECIIKHRKR